MHVKEMKGVVAALVTPFDDHDQVNEESLRRIVRHILGLGAVGFYVCGSTYNLNADVTNQITAAFRAGDLPRAREIQNRFNIYRDQLCRLGPYQSIKRCFTLMGIDGGDCRPPYAPLGPEADGHVRDVLAMLADLRRYCGLPAPEGHSA